MERIPGPFRLIGAFLLPIVLGRLIEGILARRAVQERLATGGNAALATVEGRQLASKYIQTGVGLVAGGLALVPERIDETVAAIKGRRRVGWRFWVENLADLLLGLGAVLRVAAEFLEKKQKLQSRQLSAISRQ